MKYEDAIEILKDIQNSGQDTMHPNERDYAIEYAIMALQMQIRIQEHCDNQSSCDTCEVCVDNFGIGEN